MVAMVGVNVFRQVTDRASREGSASERGNAQAPTLSRARTRPARVAASRRRSGDVTNDTRKNPSPPFPNDEPGSTITPSSSIRNSANSALVMCSGSWIHRYIVLSRRTEQFCRKGSTAALRLSKTPRCPERNGTVVEGCSDSSLIARTRGVDEKFHARGGATRYLEPQPNRSASRQL